MITQSIGGADIIDRCRKLERQVAAIPVDRHPIKGFCCPTDLLRQ